MNNLVQNSSSAALVVDPTATTKAATALAVTVSVMEPTVKATVADNARIDATGAVTVKADLTYPFAFTS
jgi:hypothetical protein